MESNLQAARDIDSENVQVAQTSENKIVLIHIGEEALICRRGRTYLRNIRRRSGSTKLTTSCQWRKMASPILSIIFLVEVIGSTKALLYTKGSPRFPYDYIMLANRNLDVFDFPR
ncbi:hypothetical protein CY35_06G116800 [Sphagnum magellanicum]|nr:hypothetical protein CY35_06G116800 [Sphagnum magellanicum]